MKFLYYFNWLIYVATIILYISVYYVEYGMCLQFILGITQILTGIITLLVIKSFTVKIKTLLKRYWVLTAYTLVSIVIISYLQMAINEDISILLITLYFVIPMCIATYFLRILYLINRQ